jgi:hypothetical protein
MVERRVSALIASLAVLLICAVLWDAFFTPSRSRRVGASVAGAAGPEPAPPPTLPHADSAVAAPPRPAAPPPVAVPSQLSYVDQLARAETRRRLRASAGYTYLSEVVAESEDSALHRWDDRATRPVRVFLHTGTAANFQPAFLDAVRQAFAVWEDAGVPVRFDTEADSEQAEVRFRWKVQFDIDRTGQTDLTWDQDGRIQTGVVTIATFDPKGRPLSTEDIRVVALHEIGHLIGLDHSSDSSDIMFANTRVRDLSARDVRSALMLYRLAPGSVR